MRELNCELAVIQKPDGSALYQHGDTKVMCGIYGPAEVKANCEIIEKATLNCILKPKVGLGGVKERALENVIVKTCEQLVLTQFHPRSAVQMVLQIMHDDGSLLSALLNSTCMAMVHAGLPMRYMAVSVCCAIKKNGEFCMDPTLKDEQDARSSFTFSFDTKKFEVISSYTTGTFSPEEYFRCLQFSQMSAKDVIAFQRLSIERFLSKDATEVADVSENSDGQVVEVSDEEENMDADNE